MTAKPTSRRWPLRAASVALIGVLLTTGPAALASHNQATAKPKPGGSINVRLTGIPECLDPTKQSLAVDSATNQFVMGELVSIDEKGRLRPQIAQSWKVTNGGKTITFSLRHDAKFSNGHLLTATDVKYTLDRALDPAIKSPVTRNFLGPLQKTTVVNKFTVRLQLSAPLRVLLSNLSFSYLGILDHAVVPGMGDNTCNGMPGAGAFKYASISPGYSAMKTTRNKFRTWEPPWYHNKGPAYLAGLNYVPVVSDETAVSELLSGDLDISDVPGTQLTRVQGNSKIALHKFAVQGEAFLEFNQSHAPFDNPAVRKAVAQVINRADIIKAALNGLGTPSSSILPPSIPMYDTKSKDYVTKLDTSAAAKAISAAHATGPYTFLILNTPAAVSAAQIVQAELEQVGMKTTIVTKPAADWLAQLKKADYDIGFVSYTFNDPDVLYLLFHSSQKQGLNFTNGTDPKIDQLTLAGRETLDQKKARADYAGVQKQLDTTNIVIPLWAPLAVTGVRSRVKGWHTNISGAVQYPDLYISGK